MEQFHIQDEYLKELERQKNEEERREDKMTKQTLKKTYRNQAPYTPGHSVRIGRFNIKPLGGFETTDGKWVYEVEVTKEICESVTGPDNRSRILRNHLSLCAEWDYGLWVENANEMPIFAESGILRGGGHRFRVLAEKLKTGESVRMLIMVTDDEKIMRADGWGERQNYNHQNKRGVTDLTNDASGVVKYLIHPPSVNSNPPRPLREVTYHKWKREVDWIIEHGNKLPDEVQAAFIACLKGFVDVEPILNHLLLILSMTDKQLDTAIEDGLVSRRKRRDDVILKLRTYLRDNSIRVNGESMRNERYLVTIQAVTDALFNMSPPKLLPSKEDYLNEYRGKTKEVKVCK